MTPILWVGPILLTALYVSVRGGVRASLVALGLFLAGWLAWSLLEYVLHRFIFHMGAKSPRERLRAFLLHGYHHEFPDDAMRLVAPPLMSFPIAVVMGMLVYLLFGARLFLPFYAGMAAGYLAYDWIHYYTHHFRPRGGVGKWLRAYHMLHHYADRDGRVIFNQVGLPAADDRAVD